MSANADVLEGSGLFDSEERETTLPRVAGLAQEDAWNPEEFARQQILALTRRIFFASGGRPIKQVVFSPAGPNIEVANICDQVAWTLASETRSDVAIVAREKRTRETLRAHPVRVGSASIKSGSIQETINLWSVPECVVRECGEVSGTRRYWHSRLSALRDEFEYCIIQAQPAGISSEAALLGALADGIVLVLGAHITRRATAHRIKETLKASECSVLGTVLSERTFPVPERVYRRL